MRFSSYGQASTQPSPANRMTAQFAAGFRDGVDINLGVGYVNESTIPRDRLVEALAAVVADPARHRQAFNYGGAEGAANLIAALRGFLAGRGGLDAATLARRRLLIGPSAAMSILEGLAAVMEPGIIIAADPMYYIYSDLLERRGFEILAIPEDAEGPEMAVLERALEALGPRAKEIAFLYFVTVNNPSCTILSNARRRALAGVAARLTREQGREVPIVFDLAYELLIHDPAVEPPRSAIPGDELGIVYETGTLSKVLAPALRIGYLLGPDGPLMNAMAQHTSDVGFSAPLFAQEMAARLLDRGIEDQLKSVNAGYRARAQAAAAAIERELGGRLEECRGGQAGFYFYLTFRDIQTHPDSPFFRFLSRTTGDPAIDGPAENLKPRVVYIPGEICVAPRGTLREKGRRQLRISYGFEETEAILRALALMREAAHFADPKTID